jgi:hypothetical protein
MRLMNLVMVNSDNIASIKLFEKLGFNNTFELGFWTLNPNEEIVKVN